MHLSKNNNGWNEVITANIDYYWSTIANNLNLGYQFFSPENATLINLINATAASVKIIKDLLPNIL